MNRAQKIAAGIVAGVPIVCCLGGILSVQNVVGRAAGTLEGDLAELRKNGFPTEPADLAPKASVSPAANAAPLYVRAAKHLRQGSAMNTMMGQVTEGIKPKASPERRADAAQAFANLSELVHLAETAADRPQCVFKRDWSQGLRLLVPEYAPMKDLARLLAFKAERQSAAGDWRGALTSVRRAQRIAQHAGRDGSLIGTLVAVSSETIATHTLRRIVDRHNRDLDFLREAQKVHADFGPLPSIRKALGTELVVGRATLQTVGTWKDLTNIGEVEDETDGSASGRLPLGPFRSAFEARYVHEFRLLEPDLPEDPEAWSQAHAALLRLEKRVDADESPLNTINQIMFPTLTRVADAVGRLQAERRITDCSFRLLFARHMRSLPRGLMGTEAETADPFGTGSLRYLPKGGGFTIYSLGPDRKDDGGRPAGGGAKTFDLVATFR